MERVGIFAGDDPIMIARNWLAEAEKSEPNDANAMTLATVDAEGMPNARMVLLKDIEDNGFVFYTNFGSQKSAELDSSKKAALVIHWKSLRRQIRVRGMVERVEGAKADAYFASRSLQSKLGAWASRQSQPLGSKSELLTQVAKMTAEHGLNPSRPPFWGGFCLEPMEIEFWADGAFRLHDRFKFSRKLTKNTWNVARLYP